MTAEQSSRTAHPNRTHDGGPALLGIYLNDHLMGATGGVERIRRLARTARGTDLGAALEPVAAEIAEDRAALLAIMRDLGLPVRRYKVVAGWAAEKAGLLKTNGRLVSRSPLSTVVELEVLGATVEGKAAGWQVLRRLAETDGRLDAHRLDTLLERAARQRKTLEDWRVRRAVEVFG
ncbi:hypothetical protein OG739_33330 [Streptomyces longwoodensis]|uniref:hypothetical protein n=1 Tax=Streptomyces longwoodensis TaxID=68231 RepID=UPI002E81FDED|nr:hypothetical protein [Streptomyces longwoodensis]WTI43525.1 hypothetical protein OG547_02880 [Streptomyces longwoodensis]WUC56283.1 hypothetical protein OHA09_03850 [Streptomyces longwoodensis]WUC69819.1 hypothetical protein OG416_02855 [Streptomyces longwoodensis]